MRSYGQYCLIVRASEILAERWTPIIVRNLFVGCCTYTKISAGAPGLSRSLLTQRLRHLEAAGVVEFRPKDRGRGVTYHLTEAGRELGRVLLALGAWGERWLEGRRRAHKPSARAVGVVHRLLGRERLPGGRVVVRFDFTDQSPGVRRLWMLVQDGDAEVCKHHPGFEEDLNVQTDSKTLVHWHLRKIEWTDVLRSGRIRVKGPSSLARGLPGWNRRHANSVSNRKMNGNRERPPERRLTPGGGQTPQGEI